MDTLPPCHRNRAHTHPIWGTPETDRAVAMCEACPLLRQCAEAAMHAGDTIDGCVTRPASMVIQAGILCLGDQKTANRLARICGKPAPIVSDTTPRNVPPLYCRGCGQPMVSWTRGELPTGRVMHYGRGYCTGCRALYRAELKRAPRPVGHYDGGRERTRYSRPVKRAPNRDYETLTLFDLPA